MMRVEWEFDGDELAAAVAQLAVRRILERYKRALNGLSCPTHGEVLILRVRGTCLDDLGIDIESCCQVLTDVANSRVRQTSGGIPRQIREKDIPELRDAVKRIHRCPAIYRRTERVREVCDGKVSWVGDVAVFNLLGHPTAMVCYAWSTQSDGSERPRYFAVLKDGTVRSSLDAVRASMGEAFG